MAKKKEKKAGKRMKKSEMSERLISLFHTKPNETFSLKQLSSSLNLTTHPLKMLCADIITEMIEDDFLQEVEKGHYKLNDHGLIMTGVFQRKSNGKNSFIPDDGGETIFIAERNSAHAMNNDKVKIALFAKRKNRNPEGEVIEILERANDTFVGTLKVEKFYAFLLTENRTLANDIFIPKDKLKGGKNGDKAVVKIVEWPEEAKNPIGQVIDILGKAGENTTEMHAILAEFGLPYVYPKNVETAAEKIPAEISETDYAEREDFRNVTTFTIDPKDAKDFDDALSIRLIKPGLWEVGVHIADVTHYVKEGGVIDKEAEKRATSVYLVDRTIPMLPERLCNFICSLRPDEEKLAFSVIFNMNEKGEQGSVGACGDLAPMAHIVSVLIGVPQAEAFYQGERMPAQEALKKAGITPVEFQLKAKDCLALLNGTTMFAGMACLNVHDAERLYKLSEITTALSLEAIRGETRAFDKRIQEARPYAGQIKAAANVMKLVEGSTRVTEDARKVHLEHDIMHPHYQERVQDNYCFRCMPQVQGVCRENLDYVKHLVEVEINAATDNPLIFPKGDGHYEFLSGGNFHGEPTGFAMDILTMSLVEIGNVSDRRCFTMCDPTISYGLPLALAGEPIGLNYGYNIICCSTSALASENKTLAFPSVCDTIPTKANQEDHVSMAPWAARKAKLVIKNLEKILGIELLLASRGIWITQDELGQFNLGKGTSIAYEKVNELIKFQKEDIYMGNQSKATISLIESDELLNAVEAAVGEL